MRKYLKDVGKWAKVGGEELPTGPYLIAGKQGTGKTLLAMELLLGLAREADRKGLTVHVYTNMTINGPHKKIEHLGQLGGVTHDEQQYGIAIIDEVGAMYTTGKVPEEHLRVYNQLRKRRMLLLMTVQSFPRVPKAFREQIKEVLLPSVKGSRVLMVRRSYPEEWRDETYRFNRREYVTMKAIMEQAVAMYDTREIIGM